MDFGKAKQNLEERGYKVSVFDTAAEAAAYLDSAIDGTTVSFGGSVTLDQMGLYEKLEKHNEVLWHWRVPEGATAPEILKKAMTTDVYVSSVNGLAETGEIVNIDGNCNRVASIMFGHKKVYLVVGCNKVQPDYDAALYYARNVAAPKNAQRLKKKTPCAVNADRCYDCKSPERICRGLSVLWTKPGAEECEVVLIGEGLGY